ncbi:hypothetical protein [Ferrimonas sp. YFM]|uniref:hypothetical protein n=1 Tax=Ferrimonas sp. YFM TaxID=3028878 RepID=UPI002573CA66|nr:hypothetical protein [Ferrimonas sp. YFM]
MVEQIKSWWQGKKYTIEGVYPGVRYKRHWTSEFAHMTLRFYLKNWKWFWPTLGVFIGLIISYKKLTL